MDHISFACLLDIFERIYFNFAPFKTVIFHSTDSILISFAFANIWRNIAWGAFPHTFHFIRYVCVSFLSSSAVSLLKFGLCSKCHCITIICSCVFSLVLLVISPFNFGLQLQMHSTHTHRSTPNRAKPKMTKRELAENIEAHSHCAMGN